MPREAKGPRLYRRRDTGIYYIRDTGRREQSTGTRDRSGAEAALARYLAERDRAIGPSDPAAITVSDVLGRYAEEHAPHLRDPGRVAYAIQALVPLLGALPVSMLTGPTCRRYAKTRKTPSGRPVMPGTARKELGVLQAALNYCHVEGYLSAAPKLRLPERPPSRDRWLTVQEVAALVRAAYRNPRTRHLARYILIAVRTGTRSDTILRLQFMSNTTGGWVDLDRGLMYRRGVGEAATKKKTPTIPIPAKLLHHLRRWQREGARYVVNMGGQRVAAVKSAWRTTLKATGIEHCTRHDLRHTAITWGMSRGMTTWEAAGFFGVSVDLIERVYGHHAPDYLAGAAAKMSESVVHHRFKSLRSVAGER